MWKAFCRNNAGSDMSYVEFNELCRESFKN